jgi:hypothetical protein
MNSDEIVALIEIKFFSEINTERCYHFRFRVVI